MADELLTTEDVIKALGGVAAVGELTGCKYSAAFNWKSFEAFPANTYLVMQKALRDLGKSAPPSLWGMVERSENSAA